MATPIAMPIENVRPRARTGAQAFLFAAGARERRIKRGVGDQLTAFFVDEGRAAGADRQAVQEIGQMGERDVGSHYADQVTILVVERQRARGLEIAACLRDIDRAPHCGFFPCRKLISGPRARIVFSALVEDDAITVPRLGCQIRMADAAGGSVANAHIDTAIGKALDADELPLGLPKYT